MKLWNHYHLPRSTDEALALLGQYNGQARIIAGGTDLLVEMRADGHRAQEALIDITRIPELTRIEATGDEVVIGAGVTHTQIVKSPLLVEVATCLVESCGVVGGPQVRNVATLGGNVAHALPAGDGTTSLVALASEAEVVHDNRRTWLPIEKLFLGAGQSLLDSSQDLLLRFRFKKCILHREATAFHRIMRPQGVALPILGCAVWVRLDETQARFEAARISIAPFGPVPARAAEVESALIGQMASPTTIDSIAALAREKLHPRTSKYRATADYRQEMIGVLLRRTLSLAVERVRTGKAIPQGVGMG